jgi:hypothetical protein
MGFLNDLVANKTVQSTTMPGWYDQAQQNVVNKAASGANAVPGLGQTAAGQAINQVMGDNNPFFQAQGSLNQIAAGAANPWLTTDTGEIAPNTATPLGGLFAAQNQQLQQLMPNYTAPVTAQSIGSGQFGSLRGETAYNKAIGDAYAQLLPQQMQAALQSQQTGAQAASALGDVGSKGIQSMTALGQAQQADPLLAASGLGKIVAGIQTPTTVTQQTDLSTLNLIGSLLAGTGGSIAGVNKILEGLNVKGGIAGLPSLIAGVFGGNTKQAPKNPQTGKPYEPVPYTGVKQSDGAVKYPLDGGGYLMMMKDGTQYIEDKTGKTTFYDKFGMPWDPTGSDVIPRDSGLDTSGAGDTMEDEWEYIYQGSVKPEDSLSPGEEIVDPRDYASNSGGGGGFDFDFAFNDSAYDEGYNVKDDWYT